MKNTGHSDMKTRAMKKSRDFQEHIVVINDYSYGPLTPTEIKSTKPGREVSWNPVGEQKEA